MPYRIAVDGVEELSHPRLKLFLSADIVGSTAFKQPFNFDTDAPEPPEGVIGKDKKRTPRAWPVIIQGFYSKISEKFASRWQNEFVGAITEAVSEKKAEEWLGSRPRLWKTVGDEVIFWKVLTHDIQIWAVISCWIKAVQEVRTWLRSEGTTLDIKCSAWLAEFPVRNRAVWSETLDSLPLRELAYDNEQPVGVRNMEITSVMSSSPDAAVQQLGNFYDGAPYYGIVDFIGPSIDTGFRLSGWASSQRMSVSIDVAYLLSLVAKPLEGKAPKGVVPGGIWDGWVSPDGKDDRSLIRLFFSEPDHLKGVTGGLRYPKFWLSIDQEEKSLANYEKRLLSPDPTPPKPDLVRDYCRAFYKERGAFLIEPFINDDRSVTTMHRRYPEFFSHIAVYKTAVTS